MRSRNKWKKQKEKRVSPNDERTGSSREDKWLGSENGALIRISENRSDSGADGICLDAACFCPVCIVFGNSAFCFRSGFPQDLVDTFPGICQPVEVPGGIGGAGGWQFDCLNASLFTAEAVVHFSRQPAVCVNRLDGSVIQDRGEVVWNNIADGTVAGSFDGTAMDGVPDGDVVPQQKFLLFLDGGWNVFLSQAR